MTISIKHSTSYKFLPVGLSYDEDGRKFHDSHADKLLLPNALLLEEIEKTLAHGQSVLLKTSGNSMLPFIVGGRDSVLLQRHDEKDPLQVGQIVLAHLPDNRYVLHRIIHIHETEITMMGDGNLQETEHCQITHTIRYRPKIFLVSIMVTLPRTSCHP